MSPITKQNVFEGVSSPVDMHGNAIIKHSISHIDCSQTLLRGVLNFSGESIRRRI